MKNVVVTGGTKGIGKAIATRLASDGWRVLVTSHDPEADADICVDLADPSGAVKLYAAVLGILGGKPPEALVNNAALFRGDDDAIGTLDFETPKKLTMLMAGREEGIGAVVNLLDAAVLEEGFSPRDGFAAYDRAKLALRDYTGKSAAMFAETLRVNAVAPGPVSLPEGVHVAAGAMPFGRPTAEDVAAAVAFLLSAERTTGAIIPVG